MMLGSTEFTRTPVPRVSAASESIIASAAAFDAAYAEAPAPWSTAAFADTFTTAPVPRFSIPGIDRASQQISRAQIHIQHAIEVRRRELPKLNTSDVSTHGVHQHIDPADLFYQLRNGNLILYVHRAAD